MPDLVVLNSMFQSPVDQEFPVYMMAVYPSAELITIVEPEFFDLMGNRKADIQRLTNLLIKCLRYIYKRMKENSDDILI
ncbi:MAG: hypothetical protein C3F13_12395 [Anaerolineales bacterium]|nr:hypothetical protein [Anaerolineae bacterium]PWB52069.1 MAG: hypothetical protein C3F13_12395 [Anaerolineales bacterium]